MRPKPALATFACDGPSVASPHQRTTVPPTPEQIPRDTMLKALTVTALTLVTLIATNVAPAHAGADINGGSVQGRSIRGTAMTGADTIGSMGITLPDGRSISR